MVTVTELRKEAAKQNIKGRSTMTKVELCAALKNKGIVFDDCEKGAKKKSPSKKTKKSPAKKFPKEHLLGRSPSPLNSPKSPAKKSPAKKSPAKKSPAKKSPIRTKGEYTTFELGKMFKKQFVKNPKTGRKIRKGGDAYNKLKEQGYFGSPKGSPKKSPPKKANSPAKKSPKRPVGLSGTGRGKGGGKGLGLGAKGLGGGYRLNYVLSDGKIRKYLRKGGVIRVDKKVYDFVMETLRTQRIMEENAEDFIVELGRVSFRVAAHAGRVTILKKDVALALDFLGFMGRGEYDTYDASYLLAAHAERKKPTKKDIDLASRLFQKYPFDLN